MRLDRIAGVYERRIVAVVLVLAAIIRLGWLFLKADERLPPHKSEMWHVAAYFAETGTLGDAYGPGSGVSSHVGPFNTIIEGLIYRAFGVGSPTSELILAVLAALVVCTLLALLYRIAEALDIPVVPRLAALALLAFSPFSFYVEMVDFRIREGAFAATVASALLLWLLRIDASGRLEWRTIAGFAVVSGFAFMINPGVALGAYAGLGFVALRYLSPRRWPLAAVTLAIGFFAVNGAWIARNERVYHRFMVSRGNFGLELDTAFHDAAVDPIDPQQVFIERSRQIHPFFSKQAFARLKTFPDDATYFAALGREANAWIADHPAEAGRIALRHLRELYFPPAWLFDQYNVGKRNVGIQMALVWSVTAAALLGLGVGLYERPRRYLFVVLTIAFPSLLYTIVQPTLRYRYAFAGLLTLFAAYAVWRVMLAIVRREYYKPV